MEIKKYNFKQRVLWSVFAAISCLCVFQMYYNYSIDKYIYQSIELNNKSVTKSTVKINNLIKENQELKNDLLHMQRENFSLVEYIEHLGKIISEKK